MVISHENQVFCNHCDFSRKSSLAEPALFSLGIEWYCTSASGRLSVTASPILDEPPMRS